MVALNIVKFANSFFIVSIEPGREVCRKALHWKFKIPSAIVYACQKRFGITIVLPNLVYTGI